jgi:hypothetical protein
MVPANLSLPICRTVQRQSGNDFSGHTALLKPPSNRGSRQPLQRQPNEFNTRSIFQLAAGTPIST